MKDIPQNIQALKDALEGIGIKSYIGPVKWANGDDGFSVQAGTYIDEYINGDGELSDRISTESLINFAFNSKTELIEIESIQRNILIEDINSHNLQVIRRFSESMR